jgi:hypothetical protein
MKKMLLIITYIILASNISYGQQTEIVKNSKNEEIVLKSDNSWESIEEYHRKMEFKKMVQVENINIERKNNNFRRVSFDIVNNSEYELEYAVYKIKILFGDEYSLRNISIVRNLNSGERIEMGKTINVDDIDGRDIIIEVSDFKMKTR